MINGCNMLIVRMTNHANEFKTYSEKKKLVGA